MESWSKYLTAQLVKIPRCCRVLKGRHFANDITIILDDQKFLRLDDREILISSGEVCVQRKLGSPNKTTITEKSFSKAQRFWHCYIQNQVKGIRRKLRIVEIINCWPLWNISLYHLMFAKELSNISRNH